MSKVWNQQSVQQHNINNFMSALQPESDLRQQNLWRHFDVKMIERLTLVFPTPPTQPCFFFFTIYATICQLISIRESPSQHLQITRGIPV